MSTSRNDTAAPAALFKPFEWVSPDDQVDTGRYVAMSNIRDLVAGVALALQIVERSDLQRELGDAPIIDSADAKRFTSMAIAAMSVIEGYIDEHFDDMSDVAERKRRAHKGAGA